MGWRILLFLVLLTISQPAIAAIVRWEEADGGNGHYYEFVDTQLIWTEAFADAQARSYMGMMGHLVTITSDAENAFVAKLTNGGLAWIGLTDDPAFGGTESSSQADPTRDGWVWVTGEDVDYVNWYAREPNNGGASNEHYAMMNWGDLDHTLGLSYWNDGTDIYPYYFVVEYEPAAVPEPSTLCFLGTAVIGAALAIRRNRKGVQHARRDTR